VAPVNGWGTLPFCGACFWLVLLSPGYQWRAILGRLRRARLLAAEDPHSPRHLDTHPLVCEFFGEQLQSQRTEAWKECNRRLYEYYRTFAPQLPDSFKDMARNALGDTIEGLSWIEQGIEDYRAIGALIGLSVWLALEAEALYLADRISEALEAIKGSTRIG
jgi:hypothetical protein